jgi:hypothetical protein
MRFETVKLNTFSFLCFVWGALLLGSNFADVAAAETARLRVKDLEVENVRSPDFKDSRNRRSGSMVADWLRITVEYEVSVRGGQWLDKLALDWTVALQRKKGKPILLHKVVPYRDIEEGTNYAVAYVRPGFIRRYCQVQSISKNDVSIFLVLKAAGSPPVFHHYPKRPSSRWWELTSPQVKVVDGELLNRLETPFAAMDYDYYNVIELSSP